MPVRDNPPFGAPCWTDLWTSDVEGSRRFYSELLGWEALEPNADFGGYFMFTRAGVPVAGGMGASEDLAADDMWKVYLATDDAEKTVAKGKEAGAQVVYDAMEVEGLGIQAGLLDPSGAQFGIWQPLRFPGFTVLNEDGAPSWFELHTRDHAGALAFYRDVFAWETTTVGDTDEFRYAVARRAGMDDDMAGIMDGSGYLAAGEQSAWAIYWDVVDAKATTAKAASLGASVVHEAEETPHGVLATLRDPTGAEFRLRTPPA
ncbi:MAG: VOC family protein [Acidimicrobiales bacterium]